MHRFFAPALDAGDETVALPKDEAEHLRRVLRLGVGDTVSVFDGRGHEFLARVVAAAPRDTRVQLLSRVDPPPESIVPVTLAQAVLKGDKMDDVVRDAVMLGVAAIQPLVTKRTESTVAALVRGARLDRWRRVALASAKQSRRAVGCRRSERMPSPLMPASGSDRRADGTGTSGRRRAIAASASSLSASARYAPMRCRSRSSASCRTSGSSDHWRVLAFAVPLP